MEKQQRKSSDRRNGARQVVDGRVRWRAQSRNMSTWAWLSDGSPDSVSFITATEFAPSLGEKIEVIDTKKKPRRYQVARISKYDDALALVGCREYRDDLQADE